MISFKKIGPARQTGRKHLFKGCTSYYNSLSQACQQKNPIIAIYGFRSLFFFYLLFFPAVCSYAIFQIIKTAKQRRTAAPHAAAGRYSFPCPRGLGEGDPADAVTDRSRRSLHHSDPHPPCRRQVSIGILRATSRRGRPASSSPAAAKLYSKSIFLACFHNSARVPRPPFRSPRFPGLFRFSARKFWGRCAHLPLASASSAINRCSSKTLISALPLSFSSAAFCSLVLYPFAPTRAASCVPTTR